ncbi:hypothetical protein ACKC5O_03300 [Aeromonas schubertii]|uniref:Uncharacterized protein n=1 Tax=Aeromonas schubertii TaxID=652 RepID=A0ABS7V7I6_9GAMM|nr:hypothetical protein [Aeromonas schubertii]KUE79608.1 hypothetical protein ATO46_06190 [Aeromonas schubertii]MBZ6065364.1 hypothetical protein [Aeromonas schubertii]QCG49275.1 hypothetical protein E2P79_16870 [Aeromonas schubertii]
MNHSVRLPPLVMLAALTMAPGMAAIPNFDALCAPHTRVWARDGRVYINDKMAIVHAFTAYAYRAQRGDKVIDISLSRAMTPPGISYSERNKRDALECVLQPSDSLASRGKAE